MLTDAAGATYRLPVPKAAKAKAGAVATPAINLDDYLNVNVTVTAKGYESTDKKGNKKTHVSEIVSIDKVAPQQ